MRNEINNLSHGKITSQQSTSFVLFTVILEAEQEDLIYVMKLEGVDRIVHKLMVEFPSLKKRFPLLASFARLH